MPRSRRSNVHRQDDGLETGEGDEEVQQASENEHPNPQEQRTTKYKEKVSDKVGLTIAELDGQFVGVEMTHNFWYGMQKLVDVFHGTRCGWEAIKAKLAEAQAYRQSNNVKGTNKTKEWQPWDVKRAGELLSASLAQSFTTEPSIPEREGGPELHVLFCPIGTPKHLEDDESGVRSFQVIPGDRHCGSMLTKFENQWRAMEEDAGPGMVYQVGLDRATNHDPNAPSPTGADANAVWVHGVIAAILWAETKRYISAEFHTWEWLNEKTQAKILDKQVKRPGKPLLIFLHLRRPHWREKNSDISANLANLYHFWCTTSYVPGIRYYPSINEVLADCDRAWGMKALEAVAKKAPAAFSWRPKVCFGNGQCSLPKDNKVLIRRGSKTGPGATFFGDWNDPAIVKLLPVGCQVSSSASPARRRSSVRAPLSSETSKASEEASTFHQELVSTLETWGEIVVFMVGDKILYTLMVTDECSDDAYRAALTADTCFKDWTRYGGRIATDHEAETKKEELDGFCRWWRSNLLEHDKERFESLEVGVRFDIGISEASPDGKFFIHEVTRWTGADFYASHPGTSAPYDFVPRQLGIAFGKQFASWREGPDDEETVVETAEETVEETAEKTVEETAEKTAEKAGFEEASSEEDEETDDDVPEGSSTKKRKRATESE